MEQFFFVKKIFFQGKTERKKFGVGPKKINKKSKTPGRDLGEPWLLGRRKWVEVFQEVVKN